MIKEVYKLNYLASKTTNNGRSSVNVASRIWQSKNDFNKMMSGKNIASA